MSGFKQLAVWQKSYDLTLKIYKYSGSFPNDERYGITSQLRRAAYSVPSNIAEGYERNHRKEYVQFLHIAKGSLGEIETFLMLCRDLTYLTADTYQELEFQRAEVGKMLKGLISSLSTNP
jgi:four helix bundle protein